MASGANKSITPLAERLDVHKSCKSLETLLSVFNDYCEAAGAVVTLQKKLVKALRETASMKATVDIAANTLNASANIYEALSDVDSKFTKLADKEYDAVSAEVKKWFKKLSKEERMHDDRIASANAKIKQAGQIYEKKSKKNPIEANDEHARYINLISTMGPEISQEKYNHSLLVTQRHTVTIYSVAASISRVADAEWLRSCESVRRFSPNVGKLGEWRALCEGGWTGPLPSDLPDIDGFLQPSLNEPPHSAQQPTDDDERVAPAILRNVAPADTNPNTTNMNEPLRLSAQEQATERLRSPYDRDQDDAQNQKRQSPLPSPVQSQAQQLYQNRNAPGPQLMPPPTSFEPPRKFTDEDTRTGSVRSLSLFPSPPTHIPPPPQRQRVQQPSALSSHSSAASHISMPTPNINRFERRTPGSEDTMVENKSPTTTSAVTGAPPSPELRHLRDKPAAPTDTVDEMKPPQMNESLPVSPAVRTFSSQLPQILDKDRDGQSEPQSTETVASAIMASPSRDLVAEERELATDGSRPHANSDIGRAAAGGKPMERSDTGGSNVSIVAAMRNRYSKSGSSSPPPKEVLVPRLPLSVNDLASRYQDGPSSPRMRAASPTGARPIQSIDTFREAETYFQEQSASPKTYTSGGQDIPSSNMTPTPDDEIAQRKRRQQRLDQLAELELKEKEQELRLREQEIELRARELERERVNFMGTSRDDGGTGGMSGSPRSGLRPRERQLSFQQLRRPLSHQIDSSTTTLPSSASMTRLVPPISAQDSQGSGRGSPQPSYASSRSTSNHAPYCGCEACSASKYKTSSPSPIYSPVRPNEKGKPKGWMRRLSMPIVAGNAFLDSKRNKDAGKNGALSIDTKIGSPTMLRSAVAEDGRISFTGRRSYDSGGISNTTNVGFNERR